MPELLWIKYKSSTSFFFSHTPHLLHVFPTRFVIPQNVFHSICCTTNTLQRQATRVSALFCIPFLLVRLCFISDYLFRLFTNPFPNHLLPPAGICCAYHCTRMISVACWSTDSLHWLPWLASPLLPSFMIVVALCTFTRIQPTALNLIPSRLRIPLSSGIVRC